ncbi:MAG: hypothetical protein H8E41_08100 [Desulfobulbaceae bacterium]|uniref:Uncharacterized protein n=1 Tax=Candidatus Desulfobia pelagia TaxID=2841692 RepID=A0A8J6TCP4_9BACT|nr:hypothetical protein [Candidatus Desulfobia pelagia]
MIKKERVLERIYPFRRQYVLKRLANKRDFNLKYPNFFGVATNEVKGIEVIERYAPPYKKRIPPV